MELDEVCAITSAWEEEWYGGPNEGLMPDRPLPLSAAAADGARTPAAAALVPAATTTAAEGAAEAGGDAAGAERAAAREASALEALARSLCEKARVLSLDKGTDSPFAVLAKENDILWSGGMPDDCTVVCLRVTASSHDEGVFKK